MSLIKHSFQTFAFQVAGFLMATISGILVARWLGPTDRGLLAVINLYPSLFFTISHLTVGLAILHHIGKKRYKTENFAGNALFLSGVLGFIGLVIFIISLILLKEIVYKNINSIYLFIAMLSLPFYFVLYYFSSILQGTFNITWYNIAQHFPKMAGLAIAVILIFVGRLRVPELVVSGVLLNILISLLVIYPVWRLTKERWSINFILIKELLRDGLKIHIGGIATLLATRSNILIINYYLDTTQVGYFYVALVMAELLWFVSIAVETSLYPKTSSQTLEEASYLTMRACRQVLLLTFTGGILMAIFGKYLILLYGGKAFLPATLPLLILLPGSILYTFAKVLSALWVRKGWFIQLTYMASAMAAINIILNLILVPKYGMIGAAYATTISHSLTGLLGILLYYKFVNRKFWQLFWFEKADLEIYYSIFNRFNSALHIR